MRLEQEYIQNLQQQIYFLEMECQFLRSSLEAANKEGGGNVVARRNAEEVKRLQQQLQQLQEQSAGALEEVRTVAFDDAEF